MTFHRPIRIAYANDQIFPLNETDAEQLISAMSAVGGLDRAEVCLLLPARFGAAGVTAEELAEHYEVAGNFRVATRRSLFPSVRGLEKTGHALATLRMPEYRGADLLYTRNLPTAMSALSFGDKPVVYETFRPWPRQHPSLTPLLRRLVTHRRFLGAVTHSKLAGQAFLDIGLAPEKLLVAYNGYDPKRLEPVLDRETAREMLGLPRERAVVTYLGHVRMAKGLGIMLELASRYPDAEFVIVGSTGEGEVERRAAAIGNVRVVGWKRFRDTSPYLYASDILFIPPTVGPLEKVGNTVLPIKTFLYMASGRAIFGPSSPDLLEVLESERNALLVTPDDPDAAARGLGGLLASPDERRRLGACAASDVAALTWERRAIKILGFLEERLAEYGAEIS